MKFKLKRGSKASRNLFSFAIFVIGVVVGIAIRHYYKIPLAQEVNIVDVAMLVTTVFLAVYVPAVLDKRLQVRRDEAQVIERRVIEIQGLFRRINTLVQSVSVNYESCLSINNLLDICGHQLGTIATLLSYFDKDHELKPDVEALNELFKKRHNLLFMNPVPPEGKTFSQEERNLEEQLYNDLDRQSSMLLFKMNTI